MVRIVAAGNNIRITNDKRKDDAPAAPLVVTLKSVVVGVGSDGRDITSCVLEKVASGEAGQTTTSTGLSDEHQEALQALKVAGGVNVRTADWQQRFQNSSLS